MDQLTLRQPVLTGDGANAPVKRGREAGFLALFLIFALYLIVPMIGMALFSVGDSCSCRRSPDRSSPRPAPSR